MLSTFKIFILTIITWVLNTENSINFNSLFFLGLDFFLKKAFGGGDGCGFFSGKERIFFRSENI